MLYFNIYNIYKGKFMNNIILIGMPSCGKSTVGVLLAKGLGYKFLDSDLLIQAREGKLLHELIRDAGNDGFIKIENSANLSIDVDNTVIATGGSVVYCPEAMAHLATLGKIVYIKISYETLAERLGDYVHRGVVMPDGYTLLDMYRERAALYEKYADYTFDTDGLNMTETLIGLTTLCHII